MIQFDDPRISTTPTGCIQRLIAESLLLVEGDQNTLNLLTSRDFAFNENVGDGRSCLNGIFECLNLSRQDFVFNLRLRKILLHAFQGTLADHDITTNQGCTRETRVIRD